MKIHIRILISVILGVIGSYYNNEFLLKNNYINYEITHILSPNFSKIKNRFDLEITEKKLTNIIIASQKIINKLECKGAEIEISSTQGLAISVQISWKNNKQESIGMCEKVIFLTIRESASKIGLSNEFQIISSNTIESTKAYNKLTPYLLFLIIGGAIFLLTGIRPK
jgi:hypothetical protein